MAWSGGTYYITRVNQEKNVYGCGSLLGLQLPPLPIAFCNAFTGFALLDFFKSNCQLFELFTEALRTTLRNNYHHPLIKDFSESISVPWFLCRELRINRKNMLATYSIRKYYAGKAEVLNLSLLPVFAILCDIYI